MLDKGELDKAVKFHERFAKFQVRAREAGLPVGYIAHEVSGAVVVGCKYDNSVHEVFVSGKSIAKFPKKADALDRYFATRDSSNGGKTNAEYVDHFGGKVDVAPLAKGRFARMDEKGIVHKARLATHSKPAPAPKKKATKK
jgi:hypothetical protein